MKSLDLANKIEVPLSKNGFKPKVFRKCPRCHKRLGIYVRPSQLDPAAYPDVKEEWCCIRCLAFMGDPRWFEEIAGVIFPPPHGFKLVPWVPDDS